MRNELEQSRENSTRNRTLIEQVMKEDVSLKSQIKEKEQEVVKMREEMDSLHSKLISNSMNDEYVWMNGFSSFLNRNSLRVAELERSLKRATIQSKEKDELINLYVFRQFFPDFPYFFPFFPLILSQRLKNQLESLSVQFVDSTDTATSAQHNLASKNAQIQR